jgi:hypothetical protein
VVCPVDFHAGDMLLDVKVYQRLKNRSFGEGYSSFSLLLYNIYETCRRHPESGTIEIKGHHLPAEWKRHGKKK